MFFSRSLKYALIAASCMSVLSIGACKQSAPSSQNEVLVKINGKPVSYANLDSKSRMHLYTAEVEYYQSRRQALEQIIADRLMEDESKKLGISMDELRKREIEGKIPEVTDAQVDEFYKTRKDQIESRLKEMPKDKRPSPAEIKKTIQQSLGQRANQERYAAYLEELKSKNKVEIALREPEAPRVDVAFGDNNPTMGPKDAKVKIIEFSDFECPFCARALPVLKQIKETYGDKVSVTFRDFPLSFHRTAKTQAQAGACAHEQNKFWEFHDKIFSAQGKVQTGFNTGKKAGLIDTLSDIAKDSGLDRAKFKECLESGRFANEIEADTRAGADAGVSSTPSFFVNGRLMAEAQPFAEFKRVIDEELKR